MRFLRAHLILIMLVTLVVVGAAAMLSWSQTPMYQSQADVVVVPGTTTATTQQAINMGTEKGIASSGEVIAIASRSLGVPQDQLDNGLSVSVPVDTELLQIKYSYPNPEEARRRAQGLADAYVAFRSPPQPSSQSAKKSKHTTAPSTTASTTPQASIVTNASMPKKPASPNHPVTLIVALIIGAGLGLGIAMIRDRMDDRLRGPLDLETQAGAPVLALIPPLRLRRHDDGGLVTLRGPDTLVAEAYRSLRTRVLHEAKDRNAKTLLVTSPAWEEKTTVAANLAVSIAHSGRLVVLVCADLRWGLAHKLLGVDNGIGLTSLLDGRSDLAPALHTTETRELLVLPPGPAVHDPGAVLQGPALRKALGEIQNRADFVVVDGPPLLTGADAVALAELTEMFLLTEDARHSTRSQVRAAVHELPRADEKLIGCVLDKVGRAVRMPKKSQILPHHPIIPSRAAQRVANRLGEAADPVPQQANAQTEAAIESRPPARPDAISEVLIEAIQHQSARRAAPGLAMGDEEQMRWNHRR